MPNSLIRCDTLCKENCLNWEHFIITCSWCPNWTKHSISLLFRSAISSVNLVCWSIGTPFRSTSHPITGHRTCSRAWAISWAPKHPFTYSETIRLRPFESKVQSATSTRCSVDSICIRYFEISWGRYLISTAITCKTSIFIFVSCKFIYILNIVSIYKIRICSKHWNRKKKYM